MRHSITSYLLSIFLIILTGCSSKIEGEVFVVTKGGESKKLALVDVNAYKIDDIDNFKKSLNTTLFDFAKTRATAELSADKPVKHLDLESVERYFSQNLMGAIGKLTENITPIKAQSDADGRFQMNISSGDYLIVAIGSRQALGEDYFWLMRSPKNGKLRLANDSMFNQGCEACLLSFIELRELLIITNSAAETVHKKAEEEAKIKREETHKKMVSEIDPNERNNYDGKNCIELKKMAASYPGSLYAERIEFYILKRWNTSVCQ